mgnify:FL=1
MEAMAMEASGNTDMLRDHKHLTVDLLLLLPGATHYHQLLWTVHFCDIGERLLGASGSDTPQRSSRT